MVRKNFLCDVLGYTDTCLAPIHIHYSCDKNMYTSTMISSSEWMRSDYCVDAAVSINNNNKAGHTLNWARWGCGLLHLTS